jgi:hypothetical protein
VKSIGRIRGIGPDDHLGPPQSLTFGLKKHPESMMHALGNQSAFSRTFTRNSYDPAYTAPRLVEITAILSPNADAL